MINFILNNIWAIGANIALAALLIYIYIRMIAHIKQYSEVYRYHAGRQPDYGKLFKEREGAFFFYKIANHNRVKNKKTLIGQAEGDCLKELGLENHSYFAAVPYEYLSDKDKKLQYGDILAINYSEKENGEKRLVRKLRFFQQYGENGEVYTNKYENGKVKYDYDAGKTSKPHRVDYSGEEVLAKVLFISTNKRTWSPANSKLASN